MIRHAGSEQPARDPTWGGCGKVPRPEQAAAESGRRLAELSNSRRGAVTRGWATTPGPGALSPSGPMGVHNFAPGGGLGRRGVQMATGVGHFRTASPGRRREVDFFVLDGPTASPGDRAPARPLSVPRQPVRSRNLPRQPRHGATLWRDPPASRGRGTTS